MGELVKARLLELVPSGEDWNPGDKEVTVQFNPTTLKVRYANQISGGDQAGGSPKQFVGQSTTSMSVELWFDTAEAGSDVRELTRDVAYFIQPKAGTQEGKEVKIPPRVRFLWGSFLFDGIVTSVDETLEFFSESGIPLRASTSLSISEQAFQFTIHEAASGGGAAPGRSDVAGSGDTLQGVAERNDRGGSWQEVGEANGVDDPRSPGEGAMIRF